MPHSYSCRLVLKYLRTQGFAQVSQNGSHRKLKNKQNAIVIIPIHNKDIPYGTLQSIIKQSGIARDIFLQGL